MLDESRKLATADASVVLQAVDEIQKSFEVDALLLKADSLGAVLAATTGKDASQSLAETLLPLINEAACRARALSLVN